MMDTSVSENTVPENSIHKTSHLPVPQTPAKALKEMSDSQNNIKSMPPSKLPSIAKLNSGIGIMAPMMERESLAERAGRTNSKSNLKAPNERPALSATSLVKAARTTSMSSSTSTRPRTVRNVSSKSSGSSINPGRSHTSQGSRSQTSHSNYGQSNYGQSSNFRPKSAMATKRSASQMEGYSDDGGAGAESKREGAIPFSSNIPSCYSGTNFSSSLRVNKQRSATPVGRSLKSIHEGSDPLRDISVSTALSRLRLDDIGELPEAQELAMLHVDRSESAIFDDAFPLGGGGYSTRVRPDSALSNVTNRRPKTPRPSTRTSGFFQEPEYHSLLSPKPPSGIPVARTIEGAQSVLIPPPSPPKPRHSPKKLPFLTKDSNVPTFTGWDIDKRMQDMESMATEWKQSMTGFASERKDLEDNVASFKVRVAVLESVESQLKATITSLQAELNIALERVASTAKSHDDDRRAHRDEVDELSRKRRNEVDQLRSELTRENDRQVRENYEKLRETHLQIDKARRDLDAETERLVRVHREELDERDRRNQLALEDERRARIQEVEQVKAQITVDQQNLDLVVGSKDQELQQMQAKLREMEDRFEREQNIKANLQKNLDESLMTSTTLRTEVHKLEAHVEFLKSDVKGQSDKFVDMEKLLEEAKASEAVAWASCEEIKVKLIQEETVRRSLFNQVQELKGNIRVMCRVRPASSSETTLQATINYPDSATESKELSLAGPTEKSSLGNISRKTNAFEFDRVFGPACQNGEVFEEISQLVQSALDGYNVCIFCYGQTGAGKTHTMSSADGMIPRATHQIYDTAKKLEEKGWSYTMEGSFIEVYNEEIHDLLGNPKEFDKKKHEIRHDEARKQTSVTGLKTVALETADTVEVILKRADANRSVAATKSNERSSRSHSVFILKLLGKNSVTGEISEGTLNLVDLAGSERLKSSQAEGVNLKETQNINKSLSCLGDVIGALGAGKEGGHIPYRNSKLTYLLQYSLGGNSKTLMFVMISPLEVHLKETLTSLKFATKVHNTHIGTAKKSTKVRD